MAREVHDREDLLREATALVERVELRASDPSGETIVCGFRSHGELSIYWGQDEVAQFNQQAEFRRGFRGGGLLASYGRKLFWLVRDHAGGRANLRRKEFSIAETTEFIQSLQRKLAGLQQQLADISQYDILGEVPRGSGVVERVLQWLETHDTVRLATHPGIARQRK